MKYLMDERTEFGCFDWFYVIGTSPDDCIEVDYHHMTTEVFDKFWDEIRVVYHNCGTNNCTIFGSYEKAKEALEEIRRRKNEIMFQNVSVFSAIIDGHDLDVDALKIYALQPVEVKEDDE